MKNKIVLSILLFLLMLSITGCSKKKKEYTLKLYVEGMDYTETARGEMPTVNARYYPIMARDGEDPSDVMPIGGFYCLYQSGGSLDGHTLPNLLDEKYFELLYNCGVNMFVYGVDKWSTGGQNTNLRKSLALCEKYNIGYFIEAFEIDGQLGTHTEDFPLDEMKLNTPEGEAEIENLIKEITDNGNNKAFIGLHGYDEPFTKQLDNLGILTDVFYSVCEKLGYDNYDIFMNANGYWANENNFWGYSDPLAYDEYIKMIFETVNPRMLSVTQYPYVEPNTKQETITALMTDRLSTYRDYAKEFSVPFWRMLQAGGQWNDNQQWIKSTDPYPNEGEFLYDVNMALAYGAKAIQYFPLVEPLFFAYQEGYTYDFENRNGLIGADGNLTRWYYYAEKANKEIQAIDHILMHAESERILVHGENAIKNIITNGKPGNDIYASDTYRELKSVLGDDCVIGCFNYNGKRAYYVVNDSRENKANITLEFDNDNYLYEVIQRGESVKVVGGAIPLTLDPGEGTLILLY